MSEVERQPIRDDVLRFSGQRSCFLSCHLVSWGDIKPLIDIKQRPRGFDIKLKITFLVEFLSFSMQNGRFQGLVSIGYKRPMMQTCSQDKRKCRHAHKLKAGALCFALSCFFGSPFLGVQIEIGREIQPGNYFQM